MITENSLGQPIADTTEKIANFWKWFSNSKVVDTQGRPIVVYHGSPDVRGIMQEGFKSFSRGKAWFASSDSSVAGTYADPRRAWDYQNSEPHVLPLYLSVQNPMQIDAKGTIWKDTAKHVEEARAKGHDGLIIKNSVDNYNNVGAKTKPKASTVFVWFEPQQAKSAIQSQLHSRVDKKPVSKAVPNSGDFSPDSADVTAMEVAKGENVGPSLAKSVVDNSSLYQLETQTRGNFTYRFGFHENDKGGFRLLLVLKEGRTLVGCIVTTKRNTGINYKSAAEVSSIYVAANYRNTGIGKQLMEEARRLIPAGNLLTSSDEIGEMAVRNWCALVRKHSEIYMVNGYTGEKVDADFSGSMPVIEDNGNTFELDEDPNGPPYYFVWPK